MPALNQKIQATALAVQATATGLSSRCPVSDLRPQTRLRGQQRVRRQLRKPGLTPKERGLTKSSIGRYEKELAENWMGRTVPKQSCFQGGPSGTLVGTGHTLARREPAPAGDPEWSCPHPSAVPSPWQLVVGWAVQPPRKGCPNSARLAIGGHRGPPEQGLAFGAELTS